MQHDLESFETLPRYIWNTRKPPSEPPRLYLSVEKGFRWIAYALKKPRCITGFYECIQEASYRDIPEAGRRISNGKQQAWMIEGKEYGQQPRRPVSAPPINELLNRNNIFKGQALIWITEDEFNRIQREYVSKTQ